VTVLGLVAGTDRPEVASHARYRPYLKLWVALVLWLILAAAAPSPQWGYELVSSGASRRG
jgi:hypothetical protein